MQGHHARLFACLDAAELGEQAPKAADIGKIRDVPERDGFVGEKGHAHQRQRRVLAPVDAKPAFQAPTTLNHKRIHSRASVRRPFRRANPISVRTDAKQQMPRGDCGKAGVGRSGLVRSPRSGLRRLGLAQLGSESPFDRLSGSGLHQNDKGGTTHLQIRRDLDVDF